MSLIKNEYTLTVDLKKPTTNIRPRFVQYDNAILYFKVYDNGKDFNFSEQTEVQVAHRKKSGRTEVGRATVITGNDGKPLIKYEYMGSEMNEVGNVTTSVSILSGTKKVTIQHFVVEILKDIHSGIVDNVNKEYSLLQQLITTVESAVQGALDSAKLVKDAVDNANATLQSANELKESWKYLDVYDLTKSYKKNNVVSYNGSSFIALTDNVGKPPVGDIDDLNWRLVAKKGADGNGTVVLYSDTLQGKKGQTVFNLTHEYDQMQNRIHLIVGGAIQHSPLDFMETSSNKVTLNYPLEADMRVVAVYFGEAPAIANDLQVQIDSIKEIVQLFDLVEIMNKGDYAKAQGDYAKQQGDIATTRANEALLAKQATETATANANTESAKVTTAISDLTQLKSTLITATSNANSATQNANNSASLATQTASNVQLVADNTTSAGVFVLGKSYKKNNLVLDNGSTWIALKDTTMNPLPILPVTENSHWRLVAQRGVDGTGSVASVNNISPDVNGNIQLDMGDKITMVDGFIADEIGNVITHSNKAVLDALTDDAGQLKYNNKAMGSVTSVNGQTGDVTVQGFSGNYNDLTNKPTSFTPSTHEHPISQVTGLQAELNAKETPVDAQAKVDSHANRKDNPHGVTASQVGAYTKVETDTEISNKINVLKEEVLVDYSTKTELTNHNKKIASPTDFGHIKVDGKTIIIDPETGIASAVGGGDNTTKTYIGDLNNLTENGLYSAPASTPNAYTTSPILVEVLVSDDGNFMIQKSTIVSTHNDSVTVKRTAKKVDGEWKWSTSTPQADGYINGWKVENPFSTSSLTSSSTTQVATANAVKQVNDKIDKSNVALNPNAPFIAEYTGAFRAFKTGRVVTLQLELKNTSQLATNTGYQLTVLPQDYRPSASPMVGYVYADVSGTYRYCPVTIATNGTVILREQTAVTPINTIFYGHITFTSDSI